MAEEIVRLRSCSARVCNAEKEKIGHCVVQSSCSGRVCMAEREKKRLRSGKVQEVEKEKEEIAWSLQGQERKEDSAAVAEIGMTQR